MMQTLEDRAVPAVLAVGLDGATWLWDDAAIVATTDLLPRPVAWGEPGYATHEAIPGPLVVPVPDGPPPIAFTGGGGSLFLVRFDAYPATKVWVGPDPVEASPVLPLPAAPWTPVVQPGIPLAVEPPTRPLPVVEPIDVRPAPVHPTPVASTPVASPATVAWDEFAAW